MKMHQKEHREGTIGTFTAAGARGHRGAQTETYFVLFSSGQHDSTLDWIQNAIRIF